MTKPVATETQAISPAAIFLNLYLRKVIFVLKAFFPKADDTAQVLIVLLV